MTGTCKQLICEVSEKIESCCDPEARRRLDSFRGHLLRGLTLLQEAEEQESDSEPPPGYDRAYECLGMANHAAGTSYVLDYDEVGLWLREDNSILPQMVELRDFLEAVEFLEPLAYAKELTKEKFDNAVQDYRATWFVRTFQKG